MPKSLLFSADLPFGVPPGCEPGRQEATVRFEAYGRVYNLVLRDKLTVEDPYIVLVKAEAFAIQVGEAYSGTVPERAVRDLLIKQNVVI